MKIFKELRKIVITAGAFGILLVGASARAEAETANPIINIPYQTVYDFTTSAREQAILSQIPQEEAKTIIEETNEPELISLGVYKISAYCPCEKCCGKTDGITASGTQATAGRTVAMNGVPFGTHIMIDGKEYVVEDRGGGLGSKIIDVFFDSHEEALNSGLWYDTEVFMINE